MRVDDVAVIFALGPGRYCSARYRMPYDSRKNGLICVPMTWRAISGRAHLALSVLGAQPGLGGGLPACAAQRQCRARLLRLRAQSLRVRVQPRISMPGVLEPYLW